VWQILGLLKIFDTGKFTECGYHDESTKVYRTELTEKGKQYILTKEQPEYKWVAGDMETVWEKWYAGTGNPVTDDNESCIYAKPGETWNIAAFDCAKIIRDFLNKGKENKENELPKTFPQQPVKPDTLKIEIDSLYLTLTSNLWNAKLNGYGRYDVGNIAKVSVKAPKEYLFKGWYLGNKLVSVKEKFDYNIELDGNICLHAVYQNPSKPTKTPVFDGEYACSFYFRDEQVSATDNILVTGYIDYSPKTKNLRSPYCNTNLGALSFDHEFYEKTNSSSAMGGKEQIGYLAMTIYGVNDSVVIASAGGYLFGMEMFTINKKFSIIHRIPYKLNSDGSITLKNFDLTGNYIHPKTSYPDLTFYPATGKAPILWYERRGRSYSENRIGYENERDKMWNYIRKDVIPKVEENLKKINDAKISFCDTTTVRDNILTNPPTTTQDSDEIPVTGVVIEECPDLISFGDTKIVRWKVFPENATNKKVNFQSLSTLFKFGEIDYENQQVEVTPVRPLMSWEPSVWSTLCAISTPNFPPSTVMCYITYVRRIESFELNYEEKDLCIGNDSKISSVFSLSAIKITPPFAYTKELYFEVLDDGNEYISTVVGDDEKLQHVIAKKAGKATIRVVDAYSGIDKYCNITVHQPVKSLSLKLTEPFTYMTKFCMGDEYKRYAVATIEPDLSFFEKFPEDYPTFDWTTEPKGRVLMTGEEPLKRLATGISEGWVDIRVIVNNFCTAKKSKVLYERIADCSVDPCLYCWACEDEICKDCIQCKESCYLQLLCLDPEIFKKNLTHWESSDPSVLRVDNNGFIKVVKEGKNPVIVTASTSDKVFSYQWSVTVRKEGTHIVLEITLFPEDELNKSGELEMKIGETRDFQRNYGRVGRACPKEKDKWYSSNPKVATVDMETGEVTALKAGITVITSVSADGLVKGICTVRIKELKYCPDPVDWGVFGKTDNLLWALCLGGTLYIDGTGEIPGYFVPWAKYRGSIKRLVIEEGVSSIDGWAFFGCSNLADIKFPNSMISIGDLAFGNCQNLVSVAIPRGVTSIDEQSFKHCNSLVAINVDTYNSNYSTVSGVLFNKNQTTLVIFPGGLKDRYDIPASVNTIGSCAFVSNSNLASVTIPGSVIAILQAAFFDCTGLTEVINQATTPQTIEDNVFAGVDIKNCTLRVPANSVKAYSNFPVWKDFGNIVAIDGGNIPNVPDKNVTKPQPPTDIPKPQSTAKAAMKCGIHEYTIELVSVKGNRATGTVDVLIRGLKPDGSMKFLWGDKRTFAVDNKGVSSKPKQADSSIDYAEYARRSQSIPKSGSLEILIPEFAVSPEATMLKSLEIGMNNSQNCIAKFVDIPIFWE